MTSNDLGVLCHTFTIVGRCERTGLLGIALTSSPLSAAARCIFIKANVGAISTQAYTNPALGPLGLRLLEMGFSAEKVIAELKATDPSFEYRQIGIVDQTGRSAVFTGEKTLDTRGHIAKRNMVAMGNYLVSDAVVPAMAAAFESSQDEILEERLMRALEAGKAAGGEKAGQLSSGLVVTGRESYARTDLRVDMYDRPTGPGDDAVSELRRIVDQYKPLIPYYEERPTNPMIGPWRDWLTKQPSRRATR